MTSAFPPQFANSDIDLIPWLLNRTRIESVILQQNSQTPNPNPALTLTQNCRGQIIQQQNQLESAHYIICVPKLPGQILTIQNQALIPSSSPISPFPLEIMEVIEIQLCIELKSPQQTKHICEERCKTNLIICEIQARFFP